MLHVPGILACVKNKLQQKRIRSRLIRGRNVQLSLCRVELVKLLPGHRYSVDIFFHISVLQFHWVLTESRIPLKLVLEGVRIVALSNISHEQTQ